MTWKPCKDGTLNIAHRGARSLAPEDTLAAAGKAFEAGADMWELDVCMTMDGELIVIHDTTLDRTSNAKEVFPHRRPWRVHQFTMEELRLLDFGSWFGKSDPFGQIAAGVVTSVELVGFADERCPSLREALVFTREHNWSVNVEIKDLRGTPGDACVVENVVDLIEDLDMVDHVHVSSFNRDYLHRVKAKNSEVSVGVLRNRRPRDLCALLTSLGTNMYHPSTGVIGIRDIQNLRNVGVDVLIWVVNEQNTMREWIKAGVRGIFTDFPQTLGIVQREVI